MILHIFAGESTGRFPIGWNRVRPAVRRAPGIMWAPLSVALFQPVSSHARSV